MLSKRRQPTFYVGNQARNKAGDDNDSLELISTKQTLQILRNYQTRAKTIVVTPEIYPSTMSTCRTLQYLNKTYIISSFIDLLLGHFASNILVPVQLNSSIIYHPYLSKDVTADDVMLAYLATLDYVDPAPQKALKLLEYNVTVYRELHHLLTLQYYLNTQEFDERKKNNCIVGKLLNRKKVVFTLKDTRHD
jgi:hypothetical protein